MKAAVNQHWVPQFYLRAFATPETKNTKTPKVWAFSLERGGLDPTRVNIRNVCAQRFLYSPRKSSGERDSTVDSKLTDLEGLLAGLWPSLSDEFVDLSNTTVRQGLGLFVATLYLRHPSVAAEVTRARQYIASQINSAPKMPGGAPMVSHVMVGNKTAPFDPSGWSEFANASRDDHHAAFTRTIRNQARSLAEILMRKRWSIVVADGPLFITSDTPVYKFHLEREVFGFGTEGAFVAFPLCPGRLLIMDDQHTEPDNQYYRLKDNSAAAHNLTTRLNATRFIFSQRPILEALEEINRLCSSEGK